MLNPLIQALIASKNEAADDLLLQALAIGNEVEQTTMLTALLRRKTLRGLNGIIGLYDALPDSLRQTILANIKLLHHAIRECGRSADPARRKSALKLIAQGRQGKLAYILSENLHDANEEFSKSAVDAMVSLARWASTETKRLQAGRLENSPIVPVPLDDLDTSSAFDEPPREYQELIDQRPEIEAAVARAMDVHRGKHGPDLLRATLLLCDSPSSKTLTLACDTCSSSASARRSAGELPTSP